MNATPFGTQFGTLYGIAKYEHMNLSELEADNPQIKNPNLIYAGETIYLDPPT